MRSMLLLFTLALLRQAATAPSIDVDAVARGIEKQHPKPSPCPDEPKGGKQSKHVPPPKHQPTYQEKPKPGPKHPKDHPVPQEKPGAYPEKPQPSCPEPVFYFTSTYHVEAVPGQVVNGTPPVATGGIRGSLAIFDFGINSDLDLICYNISLTGFQGEYDSPALTATHIHQNSTGRNGPPRVVFPDPVGDGDVRTSYGCIKGPFVTGVVTNGKDAGEGFTAKQIEDDPQGFYVDIHSSEAVPGAVRGQVA